MQKFKQSETTATYRRIYMFLASSADGYTPVTTLSGATVNLFRNGVAFGTQPTTPATLTHISVGHWYYEIPISPINYLSDLGVLTITVQDANIRTVVLSAEVVNYDWMQPQGATAAQVWSHATRELTASLDPTSAQIWAYATRTLTSSLDPTAAQIWSYATRSLTSSLDPTAAAIADAVWDEAYAAHTTAGTFGKLMDILRKSNYVTEGTVTSTVTPTITTFSTNLTNETGSVDHQSLLFITGNHVGTSIPIIDYNQTNGLVTLEEPLHAPPSVGSEFVILGVHVHAVSGIVDAVWDELLSTHTTAGSAGKILQDVNNGSYSLTGTVLTVTNSQVFTTDLAGYVDGAFDHQTLVFVDGSLAGESKPILEFTGATGGVNMEEAFTQVPSVGDTFALLPQHVHAIPSIADGLLNRLLDSTGDSVDQTNERTVRSALRAMRNKVVVNAGSITVYKEDDSSTAWNGSVSNITNVEVNPTGGS